MVPQWPSSRGLMCSSVERLAAAAGCRAGRSGRPTGSWRRASRASTAAQVGVVGGGRHGRLGHSGLSVKGFSAWCSASLTPLRQCVHPQLQQSAKTTWSPESLLVVTGLATVLSFSRRMSTRRCSARGISRGSEDSGRSKSRPWPVGRNGVLFGAEPLPRRWWPVEVVDEYVARMGLLPIALGIKEAGRAASRRATTRTMKVTSYEHAAIDRGFLDVFMVTAVTVANGGDNLGVYIPVFAVRSAPEVALRSVSSCSADRGLCLAGHWLEPLRSA